MNNIRAEDCWFKLHSQLAWEEVEATVCEKEEDLADILGPFQMLNFPGDFPATDSSAAAVSGQTCRHWKYQECRCRDTGISLVSELLFIRINDKFSCYSLIWT